MTGNAPYICKNVREKASSHPFLPVPTSLRTMARIYTPFSPLRPRSPRAGCMLAFPSGVLPRRRKLGSVIRTIKPSLHRSPSPVRACLRSRRAHTASTHSDRPLVHHAGTCRRYRACGATEHRPAAPLPGVGRGHEVIRAVVHLPRCGLCASSRERGLKRDSVNSSSPGSVNIA